MENGQSSNITIFPSSNRVAEGHQSDNYITQNNLVTVVKKLTGTDSYVVSDSLEDGKDFDFFIGGYYISLKGADNENAIENYLSSYDSTKKYYAHIKITDNGYIYGGEDTTNQTFLTIDNNNSNTDYTYTLLLVSNGIVPQSSRRINTSVVEAEKVVSYDDNNTESFSISNDSYTDIATIEGGSIFIKNKIANKSITIGSSDNSNKGTVDIEGTTTNLKSTATNITGTTQITGATNITNDTISIKNSTNSGNIIIGDSSNEGTINIYSKKINISDSSIIIGDGSNKSPVTINASTFTINSDNIKAQNNYIKLIKSNNAEIELNSDGNIFIGKSVASRAVSINLNGPVYVYDSLNSGNINPRNANTYNIGSSNLPFNNIYSKYFYENGQKGHLVTTYNDIGITWTGDAPSESSFSGLDIGGFSIRFLHLRTISQAGQTREWNYTSDALEGYSVFSHNVSNIYGSDRDVTFNSMASMKDNKKLYVAVYDTRGDAASYSVIFDLILVKITQQ